MKYFISQPMLGRTDDEIERERQLIIDEIRKEDPTAEIIDSFFKGDSNHPVYCLGKSLELLSTADKALFPRGDLSRGCMIELFVCNAYEIDFSFYTIKKESM